MPYDEEQKACRAAVNVIFIPNYTEYIRITAAVMITTDKETLIAVGLKSTQHNIFKSILKIAVSIFGGRKVGKVETSYKNSVSAMTYFVVK